MSFLKELRDNYHLNNFNLESYLDDLEKEFNYNENISTEGLNDINKKIITQFKKIYNDMKYKISILIHNKRRKEDINSIRFLLKINYISDKDLDNIIKDFFEKVKGTGKGINYIFNKDGELLDINEIIKKVKDFTNEYIDKDHIEFGINYTDIEEKILGDDIDINYVKFSKKSVFKHLDKLDKWYNLSNDFYKSNYKHITQKLEKHNYEREKFEENYEKEKQRLIDEGDYRGLNDLKNKKLSNKYYPELLKSLVRLQMLPSAITIGYARLMAYISKMMIDVKYTSTTEEPANPIYHLSDNDNLNTVLYPRTYGTNVNEFLPKRISFSSGILSACIGIPRYFDSKYLHKTDEYGIYYRDLYLYQGIQDKGKTTYLKPELVNYIIKNNLQSIMDEICVSSPIKIEKINKVRIYLDVNKSNKEKFIRYEKLE